MTIWPGRSAGPLRTPPALPGHRAGCVEDLHTHLPRFLRLLLRQFIDAALPPQCAGCGRVGDLFCSTCSAAVRPIKGPVCAGCGRPGDFAGNCPVCRRASTPLAAVRAAAPFRDPLKTAIHAFKYENRFALAGPLTGQMIMAWPRWRTDLAPADLVIAIPLHQDRERERGYNQADLLAGRLAAAIRLPYSRFGLVRHRLTLPQARLPALERPANVSGAFAADPTVVAGRHVLLVDDVYTTGSTLVAAAEAVTDAGALGVSAYCLARAT